MANKGKAKVLTFPPAYRCARASRDLREAAVDRLRLIHDVGGPEAFDEAACKLLFFVAAVLAHVRGRERLLEVLDLADIFNGGDDSTTPAA